MNVFPTITVVLPCLSDDASLDQTLLSLANQSGAFQLNCHVVIRTGVHTQKLLRQIDWWQSRTQGSNAPSDLRPLHITHEITQSSNLMQCLEDGFLRYCDGSLHTDAMGWIEPGVSLPADILKTVGEAFCTFPPQALSWLSTTASAPLPSAFLREGLCDGTHWHALPETGTFFRPWLWQKSLHSPALQDANPPTAAWALWRSFSQHSTLVQTVDPAATIQASLPDPQAQDQQLPTEDRRATFNQLRNENVPLLWQRLEHCAQHGDMIIQEAVVELSSPPHETEQSNRLIARGTLRGSQKQAHEIIKFEDNILSYDSNWQYPAITEQHAFHQISQQGSVPDGVTYVAYPWATLIDKLHRQTSDLQSHLAHFRAFCAKIPKDTIKVTVCQHIKMKDELELFQLAGITEIFWSHATHTDVDDGLPGGFRVHPFPLFPVQATNLPTSQGASQSRPHLFSFIGARSNQHYLTQSRNWILDFLQDDTRGQITGRDGWHYNKVVYNHQIHAAGGASKKMHDFVDTSASLEFRRSLLDSVFSLCPSGTGPNSIRLWESLGLGAIPVIIADTWAPPGDPELWHTGAIFCAETAEAIQALPDRLADIAADPAALEQLQHGGRQLWALYGPDSFIYDLQEFMLDAAKKTYSCSSPSLLSGLTDILSAQHTSSPNKAALYLSSLANQLLLGGEKAYERYCDDTQALRAESYARNLLPNGHKILQHWDQTLAFLSRKTGRDHPARISLSAPARIQPTSRLRVCLYGKHSNRTPLAYEPFQKLAAKRISLTDLPEDADVVVTGFSADLRELSHSLQKSQQKNPGLQTVVMSEEPLWDSIWNTDLVSRHQQMQSDGHTLNYHVFNHGNCDIFNFDTIPYFLLTRTGFQARYSLGLARHSQLSPTALLEHWQNACIPAAFYAEVRDTPAYSKTWPEQHVEGLSVYRTDIARLTDMPGVKREGRGWRPGAKRQSLADWHLDKLAALDMRCRVIAAYENTHQHAYISEKIFDAFLAGGIPTYYADPTHRVHELVNETAMLNTYGMDAAAAAERIMTFTPDRACAEAWLETAHLLQARFSDPQAIAHERHRVTDAVIKALESCMP